MRTICGSVSPEDQEAIIAAFVANGFAVPTDLINHVFVMTEQSPDGSLLSVSGTIRAVSYVDAKTLMLITDVTANGFDYIILSSGHGAKRYGPTPFVGAHFALLN